MVKVGMQRTGNSFGDALQKHRAHLGIETLLVLAREYQQAYGLAARMQRQIGVGMQLCGRFAEPGGRVVSSMVQADRLGLRVGKRQYFRAASVSCPLMK